MALVAVASPLAAQAPVITPAGDPSVKSDTIYRLAVKPADYQDQTFVYLLDDGVVRFEADGRSTSTYRQVVQVLDQDAVDDWAERSFSYTAGREKLTLNWIRVLRPDGTVISDGPAHEQESLAPVALDAPVYSDAKVHRVTLAGVAPNTLVDYSFTIERVKPVMPGDWATDWSVTTGRLTRRSRLIVDVPANVTPRIQETNVHFQRRESVAHGRHVYEWATAEVPKLDPEMYAAVPNTVTVAINVSAPIAWPDVARWYANLSHDRFTVTPALDAEIADLVKGARSRDDSIRAVHRWVAQDIRYVSLSLGIGGYQPRPPAAVLETMYGDCKDKATIFIALLRHMGVEAYPVLLSSSADADSTEPSISQFDHMIAAVRRTGGGYLFTDLTAGDVPYGALPPDEQDGFALVVHPDGAVEQVVLPISPAVENRDESLLDGELTADGQFSGRIAVHASGNLEYGLRNSFTTRLDSTMRRRMADAIAAEFLPGASGDSLVAFDGRDLSAPARVSVAIHAPHATTSAGTSDVFTLPMENFSRRTLVATLEARGTRRFPINVAAVNGFGVERTELRVTLPAGWRARLPKDVDASSDFGNYHAQYRQEGRVLHVLRELTGQRGVQPPGRIVDLIAWLRAVSQDDAGVILLDHAP
ncbi:MAG TPA: DUF3857 domain-containing transglutaminase family protein [Gemmatimonadales bacterium]|nr:DUF3857 domain-containing transglutaminase family protein [Gemmatimonadales bacterium]